MFAATTIDEFEVFVQKVRPLGVSRLRSISQEEKQLFHWYILGNVDEIAEYRKYAFLYLVDTQTHNCTF